MSITIDHEPLAAEQFGLRTVGQVLQHVSNQRRRLVVSLLIDGNEPDLTEMPTLRAAPLDGRTLFIETAEPREMALEVLDNLATALDQADASAGQAVHLLQRNQLAPAMEKLAGCFAAWQVAPESIMKIGQLLRLDLDQVRAGQESLGFILAEFGGQLRQIKAAVESRDYVSLTDVLAYETPATTEKWRTALRALRMMVTA